MKRDEDHEDGANDDAEMRFKSAQRRKCSRLDREDGIGPCNESEDAQ